MTRWMDLRHCSWLGPVEICVSGIQPPRLAIEGAPEPLTHIPTAGNIKNDRLFLENLILVMPQGLLLRFFSEKSYFLAKRDNASPSSGRLDWKNV